MTLVSSRSGFESWERLARPWAVLPVGANEQHGPHLPLATDTILADHFGQELAKALEAGLLPALPFLQSYEHTGFRGSLSLRPETAMAIIRDLAGDLERQNFTRLIVLNFHGGNFALKPVIRDWNRLDRPLKILHVDGFEWCTLDHFQDVPCGEIHAGAWETSMMLALHPELVGDFRSAEPPETVEGFLQQDLTHHGFGVAWPQGVWGDPKLASAEVGRQLLSNIRENMIAAVRERLKRFDEFPEYGGKGGVYLRTMTEDDFAAGVDLCRKAGWNQLEEDWRMFYRANPEGCFVAQSRGKVTGTVTTINYENKCSWVGMVLVDPCMRRRGVGTKLLTAAIDALAGCPCIKLDATPEGRQLYKTLGFTDEARLSRMILEAVPAQEADSRARPVTTDSLEKVIAYDAENFGVARPSVIQSLVAMAPGLAWYAEENGRVEGYCVGRPGRNFTQIGPVQADSPGIAVSLVRTALSRLTDCPVVMDTFLNHSDWLSWLTELGFVEQRPFIRMFKGQDVVKNRNRQFAVSGPELG